MFSARLLRRSRWSPSGVVFDSDSGDVFRPMWDILHDSGGFKPGQILGTCSGEAGRPPLGREADSGPRFPRGGPQKPSIFSGSQGLNRRVSQF